MDAESSWGINDDRTAMLPSSADENMVAVAARIQDRAMQLLLEQTKLNDAKTELQKIQDSARKESQVNDSRRRILLATTNSRNGVELELYKARDKISDYKKLIQKLREETQKIEDQTKKVEAQWKDDVENIYSRCQLEMELYQHSLETSLQANEQRANQRVEQLDQLEARARNLNEEEGALRRACQTLETDIERLEREEEDGDEEVSSLALEVREALAERTKLRRSLRDVQEESRKANDDMLRWEKEFISLSHQER